MEEEILIKNLHCVEYPGNVQNDKRMIQTLGGIDKISNAFARSGHKIECKFRPEDKFCKGTLGEKIKSPNFLLKVNIKKIKTKKEDGTYDVKVQCTPSIIGRVKQVFKFSNLNDFQYLPIEKDENGKLISLHESLVPTSIESISWLNEPTLSFLPPACFARIDSVQPYLTSKTSDEPGAIGRTRDRRSNYVKFVSYDCEEIPATPNPNTLRYIKLKFVAEEQILKTKNLLEERPVWTKNALYSVTKFSEVQLKYLLALSAYHFTSGPFRIAWVRFGYDPRKDPTSRKYQIIDYRTRGKVQTLLEKRFPNRYLPKNRIKSKFTKEEVTLSHEKVIDDSLYIFKRGYFPPHRQMFYQLCDIEIPEVQKKLENFPESAYDLKSGWLTEEFCDEVRKIIDKCILEELSLMNDDKVDDNDHAEQSENTIIDESFNNKLSEDEFSATDEESDFEDDDDDIPDSHN